MSYRMARRHYADIYGPTTGDRVRLADTDLIAEVERDHTSYGDECKFGGGKVIREGMGQAAGIGADDGLELAKELRTSRPELGVALFTGSVERRDAWGEIAAGFLAKPFTLDELAQTVRALAPR